MLKGSSALPLRNGVMQMKWHGASGCFHICKWDCVIVLVDEALVPPVGQCCKKIRASQCVTANINNAMKSRLL